MTDKERIKKEFEIPLGRDSELIEETIRIPDGCYAFIQGNKIVIRKGEEPVSEDLEKEILKYSDQILYGKEEYYTKSFVASIIDYCARIFANWQKKQILSQSIGRRVEWDAEDNASIDVTDIFGERKQEDDGEVIKVTIIKED